MMDNEDLFKTRPLRLRRRTDEFTEAEFRIIEKGPMIDGWWHAISWFAVREWLEMCLVRVCVGGALLALLALAEMVGPVAYLECWAANVEQEIHCEYRVGPRR